MALFQTVNLDFLALMAFCLLNAVAVGVCFAKQRRLRAGNRSLRKRVRNLEDDIKALYHATGTMGEHLKVVKHHYKFLKEQQEQLSLKEPSQQSYRNAIQQIRNGDSTAKIVETSGLSKGEVELLRLLNARESANQAMPTE